jgi:hypothetical protein
MGPRGFVPYGTGFIAITFMGDAAFQNVVTARHVLDMIPSDDVFVRVNTKAGGAELLRGQKSAWTNQPDDRIDVAVAGTTIPKDYFDLQHLKLTEDNAILTDEVVKSGAVGLGDEVFVAGMFTARLGDTRNIPIVRIGNIAALAEEKIKTSYGYHHAYLIEARSIDGLSGSPVFVQLPPVHVHTGSVKFAEGYIQYFMGMLLGTNEIRNPVDTIEINAPPKEDDPGPKTQYLNTGIGIVLPVSYIVEALEQPELRKKRQDWLDKNPDPNRRYKPTSASYQAHHEPDPPGKKMGSE